MSDRLRPFGPADTRAVVLPVAWRALRHGCVIRGDDGALYVVTRSGRGRAGHWTLTLACGPWRDEIEGGADDGAQVLVPGSTAAAVALCREALGASVLAVVLDASGGEAPDLIWRGERSPDRLVDRGSETTGGGVG
jgi:hypothetical protein